VQIRQSRVSLVVRWVIDNRPGLQRSRTNNRRVYVSLDRALSNAEFLACLLVVAACLFGAKPAAGAPRAQGGPTIP
jgi:hypothetical protein